MNGEIKYFERLYEKASRDPDVLERNAAEYPSSSLAGFLLLYHYKKTNHSGFEKLSKKTALHFKNANWLQFILDQTLDEKARPAVISPEYPEEGKNEGDDLNSIDATQTLPGQNSMNDIAEVIEIKPLGVENFAIASPVETNTIAVDPVGINPIAAGPEVAPGIVEEQNFEKVENGTIETAAGEIAFEPLHTVDYFASQGIKITEEPETTDKLGNQMKSFTAWLKSMKKLHVSKLGEQDLAAENQIQNSAEESNINTEILTEAMAEVLIKQDKREKAIEMYNKLSLINPSKRAYFAAKIESIKSS